MGNRKYSDCIFPIGLTTNGICLSTNHQHMLYYSRLYRCYLYKYLNKWMNICTVIYIFISDVLLWDAYGCI